MWNFDMEGLGDSIARWLRGNSGTRMYDKPIGPTLTGAPLPSNQLPGAGEGIDFSLAAPILQGLAGSLQPKGGAPAAPSIPMSGGRPVQFAPLPTSNPASIRNRLR